MRATAAPFKGPFYYYLAELRKARSQKYIKRIPKAGGGYKYVYKEHHQGGVGAQEHMAEGAAFKLSFQGQEGHFHIIKAEGDRLIVKHDELHGPDHKGVEMTKAELSALLTREHRPALEADAKKKRARVDKMKRETPRHIGLQRAERLAQEAEARAGVEPEAPAQDTERPDNFETMPEGEALELDEQTPRERLTETAREITAPAPEPVQTKNALPYKLAHKPSIIDAKRTAARNAAYDVIALIDERAGATINDPRSLTALAAKLTAKKIAAKESAFSYWGFRQREAGESARSNPHAAAFERHLSKKPAHLARRVNASDIAEFTRAHLDIKRVGDLKGKENQVKEIAARFARDSFTEALRIGEETRNEAFAQITNKGGQYFQAAPTYFKEIITNLESNTEQMSANPQAAREIQGLIPLAKRALTHYQKRSEEIQSQPFNKAEFLEGLKTSANSRLLIQGEPRGTAVKKRTEALVYEAINQELNELIEQHKKTEATPKPTPINHSLVEALEQGPLKQLKKPFRQEEADT